MIIVAMDIETVCPRFVPPEDDPQKFPPLPDHDPVCCCMISANCSRGSTPDLSLSFTTKFDAPNMDAIGRELANSDRLVTFNGRGFDLPVLRLTAARTAGVKPWTWCDSDRRRRFPDFRTKSMWHWDLLDLMTDHGAGTRFSLDSLCRSFGLPGKGDVDGSQVGEMVARGQMEQIACYCAEDTLQTLLCACKWMHSTEGATDLTEGVLEWARSQEVFNGWFARMSNNG